VGLFCLATLDASWGPLAEHRSRPVCFHFAPVAISIYFDHFGPVQIDEMAPQRWKAVNLWTRG